MNTPRNASQFYIRKHERYLFVYPVELFSALNESAVRATSIDVSSYGMQLEIPNPIPVNTKLTLRIDGVEVSGATVRYCRELCCWYRIGVEFSQSLMAEDLPRIHRVLTKSSGASDSSFTATEARPDHVSFAVVGA
jgi:hypothetical protein